ncbi:class I SAM-dependent methyltransferase [Kitasatospora sp. GP82]|uniref:class I SAM-dependent methyltransferase n=1 Tax=Kitasatospora sp. GP82 TaxID=3035089 RepID=UPI002474AF59|nr:class I SAM-dependent methyltransferase [Kitasatospora sp. GP82]MDH6124973.1 SAM-dependent methyltransferase [Kitasatospora sp. GP82]
MESHDWDQRYRSAELVWGTEPNRWVRRECRGLPPGRALDLAAGEGRNSLWLAARGWRVTALDFSPVALDRGRRLAAGLPDAVSDRLTWVEADARTHVPEPGAYDLVLIAYLHLPAEQRRTVLRTAADALAPGGTLLVVGHDTTNLTEGSGGPSDPAVLFTPDDVIADLADRQLRTVRAERVRRQPHVANTAGAAHGATAEAIDALVRLERPLPAH